MMVSLDFWFAIAYAAVSLAFYFSCAAVSMVLGCGAVVAGDFGTGRALLPGMWGFTHTGPLFIPHFYLTAASVFSLLTIAVKRKTESFGRQANMPV